ncbi:pyrimidine utilization protein D [Neorhizobium alkalisoli]|uniref:Putative carbamate hydrolase RutD n=1 Tax=Neorhizobium alkalisoli TaxID=528178 RepID=A0A561R6M8_9HYPH|nr:pyrimidine utilization protein D [Neorhizobium alkalisoli]TWF58260.1 aminoacrylate hydrolase [Neorhizobium alkalisoli]
MLYHQVHGASDAPTIILSSGLGGSHAYWAPQIEALSRRFRVVTYDQFGTGRSPGEVPENGGIAAMADDVIALAEELGIESFSLMGHALGGLIGLDLAARRPELIENLVLINAWGKADPHSGRCFDVRIELLKKSGVPAFVKAQPLFLYPAVWMSENAARMDAEEAHAAAHFQGEQNILRRIAALRAFDIEARLSEITHPTLLVATKDDLLVPFTRSVMLAGQMPNAELCLMEFGAHAVNVVDPAGFNRAMMAFLAP